MDAEVAFVGDSGDGIEKPRIIGASQDAILATDTQATVDDHDAILLAFIGGPRRADINALGMAAMVAQPRQEISGYVRIGAFFGVLNPGPGLAEGDIKLGFAGYTACVTADALSGVDEHGVLLCSLLTCVRCLRLGRKPVRCRRCGRDTGACDNFLNEVSAARFVFVFVIHNGLLNGCPVRHLVFHVIIHRSNPTS